jgi:hypothetical protein
MWIQRRIRLVFKPKVPLLTSGPTLYTDKQGQNLFKKENTNYILQKLIASMYALCDTGLTNADDGLTWWTNGEGNDAGMRISAD